MYNGKSFVQSADCLIYFLHARTLLLADEFSLLGVMCFTFLVVLTPDPCLLSQRVPIA